MAANVCVRVRVCVCARVCVCVCVCVRVCVAGGAAATDLCGGGTVGTCPGTGRADRLRDRRQVCPARGGPSPQAPRSARAPRDHHARARRWRPRGRGAACAPPSVRAASPGTASDRRIAHHTDCLARHSCSYNASGSSRSAATPSSSCSVSCVKASKLSRCTSGRCRSWRTTPRRRKARYARAWHGRALKSVALRTMGRFPPREPARGPGARCPDQTTIVDVLCYDGNLPDRLLVRLGPVSEERACRRG